MSSHLIVIPPSSCCRPVVVQLSSSCALKVAAQGDQGPEEWTHDDSARIHDVSTRASSTLSGTVAGIGVEQRSHATGRSRFGGATYHLTHSQAFRAAKRAERIRPASA